MNSGGFFTIQSLAKRLVDASTPYVKGETVADYTIDFRTLAAESGWNNEALLTSFYQGLSEDIKDELASLQ